MTDVGGIPNMSQAMHLCLCEPSSSLLCVVCSFLEGDVLLDSIGIDSIGWKFHFKMEGSEYFYPVSP